MPSSNHPVRRIALMLLGPAILVVLVVCQLHRPLFSGGKLVLSFANTDWFLVYLPWQYFGFSQWMHGHFPFWNPRVFCGIPFFAQIQSALLYPVAWVNFLCNTASAATVQIAANLCIGAIATYAWARQRGMSRSGAVLAGATFAFSGPFYGHVMAGYLTVMASTAWIPLIFLAIDRLLAERRGSGIFIGAMAICLQCLAGHAQIVYYTGLVGGIYLLLFSIGRPRFIRLWAACIIMYALGAALAAVQLLPCYFATQLSVRAGGTSYAFASIFALPPENLLSCFIPYPLGDMTNIPYLGRWYLWEVSVYAGLIAWMLACIALITMERPSRWRMLALLAAILLLALGAYTPLYGVLFRFLPGFNLFRGVAKFNRFWTLWIAILAGHGWDRIRQEGVKPWMMRLTAIAAGVCILFAVILSLFHSRNAPLTQILLHIYHSGQFYGNDAPFFRPQTSHVMSQWMLEQWSIAAALLAAMCVLLYIQRFAAKALYLLLALAIAEVFLAASHMTVINPAPQEFPEPWKLAIIDAARHDQRLLFTSLNYDNSGELLGYNNVWGYDTAQPKRYTELMAASQGDKPASPDTYYFNYEHFSRIFALLRTRYVLLTKENNYVVQVPNPMPHLQLLGQYIRMNDVTTITNSLVKDFNFRQSVILERDPQPAPAMAGTSGQAMLVRQSINDLEITADLPAPAVLLITDAYAPGWRVRPIEFNPHQSTYDVMQADDVLRAIPLAAGHHHFDLYYTVPGLRAGITISIAGALIFIGAMGSLFFRRRMGNTAPQ